MNFFHLKSEEDRQQLLMRARKVALQTIQQYDIEWEHIRFIQLSDTITFRIETSSAGSYLLRIHSDRLTKEEIQSELLLLEESGQNSEIIVPQGIPIRNGLYVYSMGVMMGKLREASARLTQPDCFVRPHWGAASFERDVAKLTRFYSRFISESSWELYKRAIAKIMQLKGICGRQIVPFQAH